MVISMLRNPYYVYQVGFKLPLWFYNYELEHTNDVMNANVQTFKKLTHFSALVMFAIELLVFVLRINF